MSFMYDRLYINLPSCLPCNNNQYLPSTAFFSNMWCFELPIMSPPPHPGQAAVVTVHCRDMRKGDKTRHINPSDCTISVGRVHVGYEHSCNIREMFFGCSQNDTKRYNRIWQVTIGYDKIGYDTIRYKRIRKDTIGYDRIRQDTIGITGYDRIRLDTIRYDTIRCDTIRYNTIR